MRSLLSYILLSLALLFGTAAWGQSDRWDRALDSYQTICDRCILLREQSLRGEEISPEELRSLLEQVSSLRTSLQKGSGSMSKAQKERFKRIRDRYTEAFSKQGYTTDGPVLKVAKPAMDLPRVENEGKILRSASGSAQNDNRSLSRHLDKQSSQTDKPKDLSPGLTILGAWSPKSLSYGAMATLTWNKAGIYIKGRSNFQNKIGEYSCLSDGTSGGKVIWTSGQESHPTWVLVAGGLFKIAGPVSLYAGSGYGAAQTLWEDASGKWATVEDYSAKGICADAGIIFSKNHFQASIGIGTITFKKPALELGLGIRF